MDITSRAPYRLLKRLIDAGLILLILAALFAVYRFHFLLFHSVAEIFSVVIASAMFMVAWNSRRLVENQYLLFLGIAYLFVGLLDLAHTFTYKGMNILPDYDANTPTQLWIAARYMESLSLMAAPVMFFRRMRPGWMLAGYGLLTVLVLLSIFRWDIFPDCYLEDAGGLTVFKILSEYVICMILVAAGLLVLRFRHKFSPGVLAWMLGSLVLTMLTELAFTTYAGVYGPSNMIGHVFKIGSFYCVYKALIETGLKKPYELMLRDLMLRSESLRLSEARFKLLSGTAGRLLAADHPQLLVNDLCRSVMDHLDCHAFFNFLVDEPSGRLHLNAWAGIPDYEAQTIQWLDNGTTVCGCVAQEQRRIIAEDIANTPDERTELVKSYGIQAYCCHPLIVGKRLIGTLSFGTRNRAHFKPDEIDLMSTVANQVALAMQRVETENTLRSLNEDLEQKVRERTATQTKLIENLEIEIADRELAEEKLRRANLELADRADQLRRMAGELTMAEQRERRHLSKVLHDGLQQYLAAAKLKLGTLIEDITDVGKKRTALDIESNVNESIQIARSLSAELSPRALYQGGLPAGLKWLAHWTQDKHGLDVDLTLETIADSPDSVKILVFESVRELLFNAVKHANVSRVRVCLESMGRDGARVIVSDRGDGFDTSGLKPDGSNGNGLGLFSIRERIGLIGGNLEIDSAPGRGSRFTITFPYEPVPAKSDGKAGSGNRTGAGAEQVRARKIDGTLRVLIVDDHSLFREGLIQLLDAQADIDVVGQAHDGLQALQQARELMPDTILMDINMPEMNGIDATRRIHAEMPEIRIIGLSMNEDPHSFRAMIEAGASDCKNKDCPIRELLEAIGAGTRRAPSLLPEGK